METSKQAQSVVWKGGIAHGGQEGTGNVVVFLRHPLPLFHRLTSFQPWKESRDHLVQLCIPLLWEPLFNIPENLHLGWSLLEHHQ